jgi:hypothetical protein
MVFLSYEKGVTGQTPDKDVMLRTMSLSGRGLVSQFTPGVQPKRAAGLLWPPNFNFYVAHPCGTCSAPKGGGCFSHSDQS